MWKRYALIFTGLCAALCLWLLLQSREPAPTTSQNTSHDKVQTQDVTAVKKTPARQAPRFTQSFQAKAPTAQKVAQQKVSHQEAKDALKKDSSRRKGSFENYELDTILLSDNQKTGDCNAIKKRKHAPGQSIIGLPVACRFAGWNL